MQRWPLQDNKANSNNHVDEADHNDDTYKTRL